MKKKLTVGFLTISVCVLLTGCHIKHEWQEATCIEPKICSVCEKTEGEALGHKWQEATCTEPKTCSVCGETEGEALGHEWQEATCTEPKTCSTCGETEGEALGHKWQEATCQIPKTCYVCETSEGGIAEHKWQEATCTRPKTCSTCGETEGEALGHEWQEATCTEPKTCNICGETEGEPLGHEAGDNDNCIRCGEYAKDGLAWSYEDYDGYGILTIWGNGNLSQGRLVDAGFDYAILRKTNKLIITGSIKDIWGFSKLDIKRIVGLAQGESLPLEDIYIEDSVTGIIKVNAFMSSSTYTYANLGNIYIGNGIEEVETTAFYQCTGLYQVFIGENCKNIGERAFGSSHNLSVMLPQGCNYNYEDAFLWDANIFEYEKE